MRNPGGESMDKIPLYNQEKIWAKHASSYIVINSIFAALSGILIVLVISDANAKKPIGDIFVLAVLVFSFCLFALASEMPLDAVDEDDIEKYVGVGDKYVINNVLSLMKKLK